MKAYPAGRMKIHMFWLCICTQNNGQTPPLLPTPRKNGLTETPLIKKNSESAPAQALSTVRSMRSRVGCMGAGIPMNVSSRTDNVLLRGLEPHSCTKVASIASSRFSLAFVRYLLQGLRVSPCDTHGWPLHCTIHAYLDIILEIWDQNPHHCR